MVVRNSVTGELIYKIHILTEALNQAENIIEMLDNENAKLKKDLCEILNHNRDDSLVAI